jgi:hypothetical protein
MQPLNTVLSFRKGESPTVEGMRLRGLLEHGSARRARVCVAALERFKDDEGRTIRFDVKAGNVDTEWYANLLRGATHGDEISSVTIRMVRSDRLVHNCGPGARGCYSYSRGRGRIVVPVGRNADVAHTLLHEYARHIDRSSTHRGLPEPTGTRAWWAARKMRIRLNRGKVAFGYQRGWERSIGELFAEDYAQTQFATRYDISWLPRPNPSIVAALERDLGALPVSPAQPDVEPLVLRRSGRIDPGQQRTLPFGLLGSDRRATFTARVGGQNLAGTRARLVLDCGTVRVTKPLRHGVAVARIDRRKLGPAITCSATLISASGRTPAYDLTLRLAIEK